MISVNAIWLFSLLGIAGVSIALLVIILLNSSLRRKEFSLLRNFPYEFFQLNQHTTSYFKPLMFALTGLAFSPLFVITPLSQDFGDLHVLCIFITAVFGLSSVVNCLLFFFDARYTKTHLVLATVAMSLAFLANALATLLSILVYKTYLEMSENHIGSLILAIVSGLFALGMLFLVVNPRLASWAKLQVNDDGSGEKTYSRGKVFVLALSEWITIALSIMGESIFLLALLK